MYKKFLNVEDFNKNSSGLNGKEKLNLQSNEVVRSELKENQGDLNKIDNKDYEKDNQSEESLGSQSISDNCKKVRSNSFEIYENILEKDIAVSSLPPYFNLLFDVLENNNKEEKIKITCDCYELRTLGTIEMIALNNLYKHEGKLLASISSGKNGGAFTVQPKYVLSTETNNYEPASWLVLDCHGGSHKILYSYDKLYNFLEFGKKDHHLFLRYTDPENFKQNDLTKKYYLDDGSILQNN